MTIKEFEKKLNEVNMPANALFRPHLHVKQADKAGLDFSGIVRREIYKNQVSVFLDMPDEETLLFTITPHIKTLCFGRLTQTQIFSQWTKLHLNGTQMC